MIRSGEKRRGGRGRGWGEGELVRHGIGGWYSKGV